jgi:soluble lytic murein transglycosylase
MVGMIFLAAVVVLGVAVYGHVQQLYYRVAYPIQYEETVEHESRQNDLPPSLVYAIIRTESSFKPEAVSPIGARGLMQITEETYDWTAYRLGEEGGAYESLFDGDTNIRYGTALLRFLLEEFDTVENALCAYHAGWGNATKWLQNPAHAPDGKNIKNIPFDDTKAYVAKVLKTQEKYRELYGMQ